MSVSGIVTRGFVPGSVRGIILRGLTPGAVVPTFDEDGIEIQVPQRTTTIQVPFREGRPLYVAQVEKDSTDDLPYTWVYETWDILADTELIVSASVPAVSGLTFGTPLISSDGKQVQVRISGGTADTTYRVKCIATTTSAYDIAGVADFKVK